MNSAGGSSIALQVRTMQIIWFAMLMGASVFAAFVFVSHSDPPSAEPFITYIAITSVAMALVMSFILPSVMSNAAIKATMESLRDMPQENAWAALAVVYQTKLIIGLAMLEGSVFFAIVAYQIEGLWWSLAAAGVALFVMVLRFPTISRVEDWCRSEYETAKMDSP
jgi:hypothetical protein